MTHVCGNGHGFLGEKQRGGELHFHVAMWWCVRRSRLNRKDEKQRSGAVRVLWCYWASPVVSKENHPAYSFYDSILFSSSMYASSKHKTHRHPQTYIHSIFFGCKTSFHSPLQHLAMFLPCVIHLTDNQENVSCKQRPIDLSEGVRLKENSHCIVQPYRLSLHDSHRRFNTPFSNWLQASPRRT